MKLKPVKISGLNRIRNNDLCDTGAVLYQLPSIKLSGSWSYCEYIYCNSSCYFSVPTDPPGNVTVLSPDSSTINVSWSHIANDSVNGVLQGYKVFYRSLLDDGNYSVVSVGPTTLQVIISRNFIYTDIYEVRVAGVTRAGVGVKSDSVTFYPGKRSYTDDSVRSSLLAEVSHDQAK